MFVCSEQASLNAHRFCQLFGRLLKVERSVTVPEFRRRFDNSRSASASSKRASMYLVLIDTIAFTGNNMRERSWDASPDLEVDTSDNHNLHSVAPQKR